MIDEENLIDFSPDIYLQCVKNGIDLLKLKNIFLTHFHEDHLSVDNLILIKNKVNIYANPKAIELIKKFYRYIKRTVGKTHLIILKI